MQNIEGFDFFHLGFTKEGALETVPELEALTLAAADGSITDVLFLAHGFRNDERDATTLYSDFLKTLRVHLQEPEFQPTLGARTFAVAGVYWPSQEHPEAVGTDPNAPVATALADEGGTVQGIGSGLVEIERARATLLQLKTRYASPSQQPQLDAALALLPAVERSTVAQDQFVALVLSLFDGATADPTEGGERVRSRCGSDLLARLGTPIILPHQAGSIIGDRPADGDDEGGVAPIVIPSPGGDGGVQKFGGFFQSIIGQVNQFLNYTTWYLMKDRGGLIGATGVTDAVRAVHAAAPAVKLHLVGHSLGGRLMAACAKALCAPPALPVDSLILLEAAFSHYGFSPDNGHGSAGFFREVLEKQVVKGPLLATYSKEDAVVGVAYAIASRLAGDNAKAVGDANDEFGGIGRNGAQKTIEAVTEALHAVGTVYQFKPGVVSSLDGSGGLIKDHGDVANAAVTYAVASAIAST